MNFFRTWGLSSRNVLLKTPTKGSFSCAIRLSFSNPALWYLDGARVEIFLKRVARSFSLPSSIALAR